MELSKCRGLKILMKKDKTITVKIFMDIYLYGIIIVLVLRASSFGPPAVTLPSKESFE